jgi:hypothetical protein
MPAAATTAADEKRRPAVAMAVPTVRAKVAIPRWRPIDGLMGFSWCFDVVPDGEKRPLDESSGPRANRIFRGGTSGV